MIGSIWLEPEVDPEKLGTKGLSGDAIAFLAEQMAKLNGGWRVELWKS